MSYPYQLWLHEGLSIDTLCHELDGLSENDDERSREFQKDAECVRFFRRVRERRAVAKAFKEFPHKGKVEREIWYRDYGGTTEERKYVIVHMHFSDDWDKNLQRQKVTSVTQVNLRHFTKSQEHATGTGAWEAMFESAYLEQKGRCVFRTQQTGITEKCIFQASGDAPSANNVGWRWNNQDLGGQDLDQLIQWFPGMPRLERDRVMHRHEEDPEWSRIMVEFLNDAEKTMSSAKPASKDELEYLQRSQIGLEVLAIGNDSYCFEGMRFEGVLQNCVKDAKAVAEEFEKLDAKSKVLEDVSDRLSLRKAVKNWAESRLKHESVTILGWTCALSSGLHTFASDFQRQRKIANRRIGAWRTYSRRA
jgi:hypothetical protein